MANEIVISLLILALAFAVHLWDRIDTRLMHAKMLALLARIKEENERGKA